MQKLTEKFNAISVKKGETFVVELESNGSTGYSWDLQLIAGKARLLKKVYNSSVNGGPMLVGSGGRESFIFKAEEAGIIELKAEYRRPWKKNNPPAASHTFQIKVH